MQVCANGAKVQKRCQITLELELQAVGSCLIRVLGTEVQSYKRAEHSLNREPFLQNLNLLLTCF